MSDTIDLVISFDTTGSMYPCLTQVRRMISETVERLFRDIGNIRIGIIAHGDYCDAPRTITKLDLTTDKKSIIRFVDDVAPTNGGDTPECYELVLNEVRSMGWSAERQKALIMIGDATPHSAYETQNSRKLDWRNELKLLLEAGIHVNAVQALNRREATAFWKEVANTTGGHHIELNQFAYAVDMILALAYQQADQFSGEPRWVPQYEQEVEKSGRMDRGLAAIFDTINFRKDAAKRTSRYVASAVETGLIPVAPGRFQVLGVSRDCSIKEFVEHYGLTFRAGHGFYEMTKSVEIQDHKEVILQNRSTGDMYTGTDARHCLGLPVVGTVHVRANAVPPEFIAFVQSTSYNRKLLAGTKFLYEVG